MFKEFILNLYTVDIIHYLRRSERKVISVVEACDVSEKNREEK